MEILIIKTGAMGDVVRTTAILSSIKEKYPDSKIHWLVKLGSEPLLTNTPLVDYIYTSKESLPSPQFDWVINLEEDMEWAELTTTLKPKKISGNYLQNGQIVPTSSAKSWFDMSLLGKKPENDILKEQNKKTHTEILLDIIELPTTRAPTEPLYFLDHAQKEVANTFRRRYNIQDHELVIGINAAAGTKWPSKNLNIQKTVELIHKVHDTFKPKIILFGGQAEHARNEEIIAKSNVPIIYAGCGNNLKEFPAMISVCNLFITTDTLGLHLALALKRKTIVLMGPTSNSEIDTYDLGPKIIADSDCLCCYNPSCKSMDSINIESVIQSTKQLLDQKVSIIITSFNEPTVNLAIDAIVNQEIPHHHEIIVADPNPQTEVLVNQYKQKYPSIRYFKDPGEGKSLALNLLFKELKGKTDLLILTDGDVTLGPNSIKEIVNAFNDPKVGCVSGRVMSANTRNNMLGFWSHLLVDAGAHSVRKDLNQSQNFLECSGYLFAFRNIISEIPLDVAEDTIIPYYFHDRGYKVGYAEKAEVFVKNPTTFKDWLKQRKRTAKAHETIHKYVDTSRTPRVKTFSNEVRYGLSRALAYPQNAREYVWTINLFFARLYMWGEVFFDTRLRSKQYKDNWDRVETAR